MRKSRKYYENKPSQESYPLAWPEGWKRTQPDKRERNLRYRISLHQSLEELLEELRKMTGDTSAYVVISSNIPTKRDGRPYTSGVVNPEDPGVAVYWFDPKASVERVIACDAWIEVRENIRALALAIMSLRQLERCRATEILDRAFRGFEALTDGHEPWWVVLGVSRNASLGVVKQAYQNLAKLHHPDLGGDTTQMSKINQAYQEATDDEGD
jgi:broad specificity phosphatase PhoE